MPNAHLRSALSFLLNTVLSAWGEGSMEGCGQRTSKDRQMGFGEVYPASCIVRALHASKCLHVTWDVFLKVFSV